MIEQNWKPVTPEEYPDGPPENAVRLRDGYSVLQYRQPKPGLTVNGLVLPVKNGEWIDVPIGFTTGE